MPRLPLRSLAIVLLSGCAAGGQVHTPASAPTASRPTGTPHSTTTATETTTVPPGNRVPLSLSNRNASAGTVTLVVTNGTTTVFDGTVRLGPAGTQNATVENVTLLTGRGTTYTITTTTENATLSTDVTIAYGVLREHVIVNESGGLEHRELTD